MRSAIIAMVAPSLPVLSRSIATNGCTVADASTSSTSPIVKARVMTIKNARAAFVASAAINASGTTLEASRTFSAGGMGQWGHAPHCMSLSLTHVDRTVETDQRVQCIDGTDHDAHLTRPLGETVRTDALFRPRFHWLSRFSPTNLHFPHC